MEHNLFYQMAQCLWKRGGDGEEIAQEMANALKQIIMEGRGDNANIVQEFAQLIES